MYGLYVYQYIYIHIYGTFFWLAGQHDAAKTSMGTRPGDCFADVVFGYAWSVVLKKVETYMVEHNLTDKLPAATAPTFFAAAHTEMHCEQPEYVFIGPTWMDDLALCVEGSSPQQLESRMGSVASFLLDSCKQHMMTPNLARGKTELLMVFRGAGSRRFTTKHYGPAASETFPVLCDEGVHHIQIVKRYRHLGGWLHHKPDRRVEIRQKGALAHEAFSRHRKVLFANQQLPLSKRAELFTTLVLTKMLYGADSWTMSTNKDKEKLHAVIMRLYKRLIGWTPDMDMSDEMIIVQTGLPSPTELLRRARLRYLLVLLNCDMPLIWSLLNDDLEWKKLIEDDLSWMWRQLRHSSGLLDPSMHLPQWLLIIQDNKSYWKRLVNRACQHAILQRKKEVEVCELHRRLFDRAINCFGFPKPPHIVHADTAEETQKFGCLTCRIACRSKAGEGAHMFRKHNIVAKCRQWYDEPSCPSCLKFFHTMAKMKAHLYYSRTCRQRLISSNMRCLTVPGTGSDADRHREEVHDFMLPPLKGEGPQLPLAHPREDPCIDDALFLHLVEIIDERFSLSQLCESLCEYVKVHPMSWTMWKTTIRFFMDTFEDDDAAFFQYDLMELRAFFERFMQTSMWSFLHVDGFAVEEHQTKTIEACHDQCQWFLEHAGVHEPRVPQTFGRHRYVLHAFSGRRRVGDLQFFLERAAEGDTPYVLHIISLDIIVDKNWGNVAQAETRKFWLDAIRSRWVIAFVGGPPCETWSRVRSVSDGTTSSTGPRVLRDGDFLWGYESVGPKEIQQLLVGNTLLGFSMEAMTEIAGVDGMGILEHPAEPDDLPLAASIWILPLMKWILSLPGAQKLRFSQGLMGAPSPKPTDLLLINMTHLLPHLHACRVRVELPHGRALGKNEHGHWRTAILKEYPPSLCLAFARAILQGTDQRAVSLYEQEPSPGFMATCRPMECTEFGRDIGHDFAG